MCPGELAEKSHAFRVSAKGEPSVIKRIFGAPRAFFGSNRSRYSQARAPSRYTFPYIVDAEL